VKDVLSHSITDWMIAASTESNLFTLCSWARPKADMSDQIEDQQSHLKALYDGTVLTSQHVDRAAQEAEISRLIMTARYDYDIHIGDLKSSRRFSTLQDLIVALKASVVESDRLVAPIYCLMNCLSTSSRPSAIGISGEELANHRRRVQSLIVAASTRLTNTTELDQKILALYAQSVEVTDSETITRNVDDQLIQSVEQCEICYAAIAFKSMDVARCHNGHQFSKIRSHIPVKPANATRSL